jgi:regulator of protease activity HflC (stomatin/prohibitin superfamily)
MKESDIIGLFIAGCIGLFLFIILLGSFTIIGGGERGVVFSKSSGVQDGVLSEGFHFKKPIIDEIIKFEVRTTKYELTTESSSFDQQIVKVTVVLNYNLNPESVNNIYQDVGKDYVNRIIKPALEGSVKSAMAKFKAEELIQKRSEVTLAIKDDFMEKIDQKYIIVTDLNMVNVDFSEAYDLAIEQKVTAEQEALRAKNELEKTKIEKEQSIVRAEAEKQRVILEAEAKSQSVLINAEAEAKAILLIQEEISKSPDYIGYLKITKWNGVLPATLVGEQDVMVALK